MRTSTVGRLAALLVGLEGVALAVLAGWQIVALAAGDTLAIESSIALIVLTVVGAAIVLAFAVGVARGQSWGRSGGIVTQALILAVAGGAATGAFAHPSIAVAIGVPAVVVIVLLVVAAGVDARAARAASADDEA